MATMRKRPPAERPPVFSTQPDPVKARSLVQQRCASGGPSTSSDTRDPLDKSPCTIKAELSGRGNRRRKARIVKGSGSEPGINRPQATIRFHGLLGRSMWSRFTNRRPLLSPRPRSSKSRTIAHFFHQPSHVISLLPSTALNYL
jgi:hypothetical protein